MNQELEINLMCPIHDEKINSVQLTPQKNEMFCQSCLMQGHTPIQDLALQLASFRSEKIKKLRQQGQKRDKSLKSLEKLFLFAKERINEYIKNNLQKIRDKQYSIDQNMKKEVQQYQQPLSQLNQTQVNIIKGRLINNL